MPKSQENIDTVLKGINAKNNTHKCIPKGISTIGVPFFTKNYSQNGKTKDIEIRLH